MPPTEGGEVGIWEAHIQALPRQREIDSHWKRCEMAWAGVRLRRRAWSFPMTLMVLALSLLYPQNDSATSGIKVMPASQQALSWIQSFLSPPTPCEYPVQKVIFLLIQKDEN